MHARRKAILPFLAAVAGLVFLAGTPAPAVAAWNGQETIQLGDQPTATFSGGALTEIHEWWFFAPAGTKMNVQVKVAKGADLVPGLKLFASTGKEVDLGDAFPAPKDPRKPKIKKYVFATGGWYYLQVTATSGTGAYTLKTKGKFPKKAKEETVTGSKSFGALAGAQLTVKVKKAKGSAAEPVITSITGPKGDLAIGGEAAKIKKLPLPDTGTYTVHWRNDGGAGNVLVLISVKSPKSKEKKDLGTQGAQPLGRLDKGDPHGDPEDGYVGSDQCRTCHPEIYASVTDSFHNSKLRNPFREGAAGYAIPPAFDAMFKAPGGTDLTTFAVYSGFQGLKVSYVEGDALPYKITVGTTTYDVMYVMGGNGLWKQRYVVKIGQSHYISPIQYNEKDGSFSAYHASDWFDEEGNPLPAIDPVDSWERRCGACHSTGLKLSYDAGTGEYLTGYAQLNIGCEACHGPGQAHVASADPADILNPRDLIDGTTEGLRLADLTCGQCHGRGTGGTVPGSPKGTGYPWKDGGSIYKPGTADFASYYTTTGAGSFWRYKDNAGFTPSPEDITDDTWVSSKSHHQQWLDVSRGPHAPDDVSVGACFDCHDPHADKNREHMMTKKLTHGGHTFTDVENDSNKLCLSCHAGDGDFDEVTAADVDAITDSSAPTVVVDAVVEHMKDAAAMPVEAADYDPAGTGTGRCSKCHMPKMAKSAIYQTDADGHPLGDIHAHTFLPVWPNITKLTGGAITNSCNTCHPLTPGDPVKTILDEWVDDPDGDGTFHADTPRTFQGGVANPERDGGMACVACHTTEGFLEIQVHGSSIHDLTGLEGADAEARAEMIRGAVSRDHGITCNACHGEQPDGTFSADPNPLRFPKGELCGKCHMNETVQEEDYVDAGEIVRHPQAQMLAGAEGGEVPSPGKPYGNSAHTTVTATDKCVTCHYQEDENGHTFEPSLASCNASGCHSFAPLATFNRTAGDDYDGDGTVEGIQDEVQGALDVLKAAILAAVPSTGAEITYSDPYFLIDGDRENTAALDAVADAALLRAIFNHYWVSFDGSKGIHNTKYALRLIQESYEELTGGSWPGVKR